MEEQKKEEQEGQESLDDQLFQDLSEICDKYGLKNATFLAINPGSASRPIMWFRGSRIIIARLTALFTRTVKAEILQDLDV